VALPGAWTAAIARGAEIVTRNSVYRAGYELIYAPLPEDDKRPAKVMLDVGADRLGDLLGAQLVTLLVYELAQPRLGLLIAAVCVSAIGVVVAMRLPRSYTAALEDSLLAHAPESPRTTPVPVNTRPWVTLSGLPTLGQAGEFAPLSLRYRDHRPVTRSARPGTPPAGASPSGPPGPDQLIRAITDLRSDDRARIQRALAAGLTPELAACAIDLIGRDDVARAALAALNAVAPRCTGTLVDALLDPSRDATVRRRLPGVLLSGEPSLAAWGLWRALGDPRFDVRYRSGAVLSRLAAGGHLRGISTDDVFEAVRRELIADSGPIERQRVIDDLAAADDERAEADPSLLHGAAGLEHVFTVLGLALPAEPLRIALHAVQTDDPDLRGTALEYLESILPPDVRAQLWPLLESETGVPAEVSAELLASEQAPEASLSMPRSVPDAMRESVPDFLPESAPAAAPEPQPPRSQDEIIAALRRSYPEILDKLRQRTRPA
jgi:hypothetical protein